MKLNIDIGDDQELRAVIRGLVESPCNDGGLQLEWHVDGLDFEFQIGPDGHEVYE